MANYFVKNKFDMHELSFVYSDYVIAISDMQTGKIHRAIVDIFKHQKEMGLITQKHLAQLIGCSQSMVSDLLAGDVRLSDEWIEKICDALGINLCDLERPPQSLSEPKELQEYSAKLKRLHKDLKIPGFRSVSRTIDDWLEVLESTPPQTEDKPESSTIAEPAATLLEFPKPVNLINHDMPQPAVFERVPYYERIHAGSPQSVSSESGPK